MSGGTKISYDTIGRVLFVMVVDVWGIKARRGVKFLTDELDESSTGDELHRLRVVR